ncbi:hypothetical protein QEH56_20240 [Pelagicoccus enzymogenes]|uniref:hypothetical protein n=1 Tax=Pelagicoccus enzymogenes TaxID=2773457 RepID=UPI00280CE516|nr:hypothetical protein [Pelagicoccus enzymogenes]MDQ8200507.1 hypothetical protein [Pelagicoccus enzymogenes]
MKINKDNIAEYLKTAPDLEIEENIAAGPGGGLSYRYSASVAEKERRRKEFEKSLRKPSFLEKSSLIFTIIASIAAVFAAYFAWLALQNSSPPESKELPKIESQKQQPEQ